ncbi:Replication protein A 70 kDa DNA-binding subunit C, partial [Linum perenne]
FHFPLKKITVIQNGASNSLGFSHNQNPFPIPFSLSLFPITFLLPILSLFHHPRTLFSFLFFVFVFFFGGFLLAQCSGLLFIAMVDLTESAVARITAGASSSDLQPVLQVTELKLVQTKQQQTNDRFRLVLSDGSHLQQAMLGTQINTLVKDNKLRAGSVVQLIQYSCTTVQNRMIIIILDLIVIVEECALIGHPVALRPSGPSPIVADQPMNTYSNPQLSGGSTFGSRVVSNSVPDQPMNAYSNQQPSGGSTFTGRVSNFDPAAASVQYPRVSQPGSGFNSTGYDAGRNVRPIVSSFGMNSATGATPLGSSMSGAPYSNQGPGFDNLKQEGTRAPSGSYSNMSRSTYQQPPAMYNNRGPIARNEAPAAIFPISALNPYQGRWTIKARVTAKSDLRHYHNPRGEGKVFSFDLLDSDGGEIRVTCFNTVADQFYPRIELGRVYTISKGTLKPAQKNFNHLNNDLEIHLEIGSIVQQCDDDDNSIPRQQFHFRLISDVEGMESNSIVDIIGVVIQIHTANSIMKKNGTETQKRTLQLKDISGRSVELTLWGNFCDAEGRELQNMCDLGKFPVLAVKSCRISDFNGKAVGTISSSQLFIEPEFEEAANLRQWFDREGRNTPTVSISKQMSGAGRNDVLKTVSQIKDESLGKSNKIDWISVNAAITFIKADNFMYTACPIKTGDRPCMKKVANNGDGKWRCDKCDQSVDECDYRYVLNVQIQDHTGLTWVTAFQESAEALMGISCKDLYFMKYEQQDDDGFSKILRQVLFTRYVFKLKVNEEVYNDEPRLKCTVVKAEKVDYVSHSKDLLDLILKGESGNSTSPPMLETSYSNIPLSTPGMGNIGTGQTGLNHMGSQANQVNQYNSNQYNSRFTTPLASGGTMSCHSCGATSHISMNCPSILAGTQQPVGGGSYINRPSIGADAGSGRGGECFKCHQTGHWARDCPGSANGPQSYGNRSGGSLIHNR